MSSSSAFWRSALSSDNRNYDFAYLNIPEWTSQLEAEKVRLQSQCGIFVAPRITRTNSSEFPALDEV
jgi:hypothetical protein